MSKTNDPRAFISTWRTTGADDSIKIPILGSGGYNYDIDCGAGGEIDGDQVATGQSGYTVCNYAVPGDYQIVIVGNFPSITTFDAISGHKLISIDQWGDVGWRSMQEAFFYAKSLISVPNNTTGLENVTSMEDMFYGAINFNSPINNWDVSNVTDMEGMFSKAKSFNQPIESWDVSNVRNMERMFAYASAFNQPIGSWDVSNVMGMGGMFNGAESFNQYINDWDVPDDTNIDNMFYNATSFKQV